LQAILLSPKEAAERGLPINQDGRRRSAFELMGYAKIDDSIFIAAIPEAAAIPAATREQLRIEALYAGYLDRQTADIEAFRRDENLHLSPDLDYAAIGGLTGEIVEKLASVRPMTLGQASRIPGMTPAALTALLAYVRRTQIHVATG